MAKETGTIDPAAVKEKVKSGQELTAEETGWLNENPNFEPKAEEKKPEEIKVAKTQKKKEAAAAPDPAKEAGEKKEEKKPTEAAGGETPEERKKLIDKELDKPEGQEDLTKFSHTEIGLYWDLKKARKKNQALSEQNEILRVEQIVKNLKDSEASKKASGEQVDEIDYEKLFEGKDADDILTVDEVKALLKKAPKKEKSAEKPKEETPQTSLLPRWVITAQNAEADGRLRAKGITDFFEVIDHTITALEGDKEAQAILTETASKGGNVSEKVYWLVKGSKKWPEIEKAIKAERVNDNGKALDPEHVARAKKIDENDEKIRTTGAGTGTTEVGEYSEAEVKAMSIQDIQKLPRETRKAILKKFGSEPNLSV